MASTVVVPSQDMVVEAKLAAAFTAASVDIAALQAGTTIVKSTVANGADLTLSSAHHNKIVLLNLAAGTITTLPAATGSGLKVKLLVSVVTTTSGANVVNVTGNDLFKGLIFGTRVDSGNAVLGFNPGAGNNKITLDHAAKGGVTIGDWLEFEDIAADTWAVRGQLTATGAPFGTPFSTA